MVANSVVDQTRFGSPHFPSPVCSSPSPALPLPLPSPPVPSQPATSHSGWWRLPYCKYYSSLPPTNAHPCGETNPANREWEYTRHRHQRPFVVVNGQSVFLSTWCISLRVPGADKVQEKCAIKDNNVICWVWVCSGESASFVNVV